MKTVITKAFGFLTLAFFAFGIVFSLIGFVDTGPWYVDWLMLILGACCAVFCVPGADTYKKIAEHCEERGGEVMLNMVFVVCTAAALGIYSCSSFLGETSWTILVLISLVLILECFWARRLVAWYRITVF